MIYGIFWWFVRALAYILTLGRQGIPEAALTAVLTPITCGIC
jgi:glycine cleavage system protein P-like pyridoxal-binding family